jgi:hypothetical protein
VPQELTAILVHKEHLVHQELKEIQDHQDNLALMDSLEHQELKVLAVRQDQQVLLDHLGNLDPQETQELKDLKDQLVV